MVDDILPPSVQRTYKPRDLALRAFGIGTHLEYDFFLVGDVNPSAYHELILPDDVRVCSLMLPANASSRPATMAGAASTINTIQLSRCAGNGRVGDLSGRCYGAILAVIGRTITLFK
ncbi:MAG: hypothetical protein H7335_17930 [Massilia sp.]|nr:hypothetical protein [Massilia sp.]